MRILEKPERLEPEVRVFGTVAGSVFVPAGGVVGLGSAEAAAGADSAAAPLGFLAGALAGSAAEASAFWGSWRLKLLINSATDNLGSSSFFLRPTMLTLLLLVTTVATPTLTVIATATSSWRIP